MNKICRLCLRKCGHGFECRQQYTTEISHVLQINFAISKDAEICTKCWESFKMCSDFKSVCQGIEDFIVQFINRKAKNRKPNLKDICLSIEADGSDIPENRDICRLCMCLFKVWPFMSLDSDKGGAQLRSMVLKCLPELDLSVTEKPVICVPCYESLQHYFKFMRHCSIVEENLKKYCEAAGLDGTGLIKLKDVLEFRTKIINNVDKIQMEEFGENKVYVDEQKHNQELLHSSNNMVLYEENAEQDDTIKIEETHFEETEFKFEHKFEDLREMDDGQFNDVPKFTIKCEESDDQVDVNEMKHSFCQQRVGDLKIESCEEVLDQEFTPCFEEVGVKTEKENISRFEDVLPQPEVTTRLLETRKCVTPNLKEDPSELHIKHTSAMYTCDTCSYQTREQSNLKRHLLRHKNRSEVTVYKCYFCSYQTRGKCHLKRHLLNHKDPSEVTIYKCDSCSYQTITKYSLKKHSLTHKNPERKMYKCDSCSFQTRRNRSLNNHLLVHKDSSEVTMYKCDCCSFQTRYKYNLKKHLLKHKCDSCSFQTRDKYLLKKHLEKHKNPSQVNSAEVK